jgi:cyclopropane fatty-acyl-phospholipid synthase-like methyltransferase
MLRIRKSFQREEELEPLPGPVQKDWKSHPSSNRDVDWGKLYDYYEVEMREMYRTVSKPQNDSHFEMLKHHLRKYLSKSKIFAEIGFSAGLTLRYASRYFKMVYGLDISSRNVEYTRNELLSEGYQNIELFATDIMKKEERFKNKFDVISFIHGLEHFSDGDYPILFENIKYYLRDNGVFTGALPYNSNFNFRICPKCEHVFEIDGHISKHNLATLRKLFEENNFEILYLSNFNIHYYRKEHDFFRFTYRFLNNLIFRKNPGGGQLEYVVRPI